MSRLLAAHYGPVQTMWWTGDNTHQDYGPGRKVGTMTDFPFVFRNVGRNTGSTPDSVRGVLFPDIAFMIAAASVPLWRNW